MRLEPFALRGSHVMLEPLDRRHADDLLTAAADRSTFGHTLVPHDLGSMTAYIDGLLADADADAVVPFVQRRLADGAVVGCTRFLNLVWWPGRGTPVEVEIGGTWLATDAQRSAINSEAKLLLLGHAFEVWQAARVAICTDARNERSRRAIERLGATFEGVLRNHRAAAGSESVPGTSVDRQCGSSQQALHFAAQAVMSGTMDIVIASGVESMTRAPMGMSVMLPAQAGLGVPKSSRMEERYPNIQFSQFMGAEMLVKKHGFTREDLDRFALESHQKAKAATESGAFANEIVGVEVETPEGNIIHSSDEGIRFDATMESLSAVKLLQEGGSITAANASQICDGASAVLIVSERALKEHGLTPRARIVNLTVTAGDPVIMLEEPLFATDR
eukprot:gene17597-36132_t